MLSRDAGRSASVAVVILNWNGYRHTAACLASLASVPEPPLHIYLVDNASVRDEAARLAREFPCVEVLAQETNLGYAAGSNVGIARALSDGHSFVLLLNNDTLVTPGFVRQLVDFYEETADAGAVSPLVLYEGADRVWSAGGRVSISTGFTVLAGKGRSPAKMIGRPPQSMQFVPGACMLLKRNVLEAVGALDERYFAYYEDVDLCFRLSAHGFRNYVVFDSVVEHAKSASTGEAGTTRLSPVAAYYMARNAFIFGRLRFDGVRRGVFLAAQVLVRAPYNMAFRMQRGGRRAYLKGVRDGLRGVEGYAQLS